MSAKSPGAALALIVLVSIVGYGSFAEYSDPHHYEQHPKNPEQSNSPGVAPWVPIRHDHSQNVGHNEPNADDPIEKVTDWLIAAFTLALVFYTRRLYVATAGLFTATKGLEIAARKQSDDMAESLRIAAISADAAKDSADISRRTVATMEASERPHLIIESNPIFGNRADRSGRKATDGLIFKYELVNCGKAPAFITEFRLMTIVAPDLPIQPPNIDHIEKVFRIWAPGRKEWIFSDVNISEDDWGRGTAVGGGCKVFIIGSITYKDTFIVAHRTNFAFEFVGWNESGQLYLIPSPAMEYWRYT